MEFIEPIDRDIYIVETIEKLYIDTIELLSLKSQYRADEFIETKELLVL